VNPRGAMGARPLPPSAASALDGAGRAALLGVNPLLTVGPLEAARGAGRVGMVSCAATGLRGRRAAWTWIALASATVQVT